MLWFKFILGLTSFGLVLILFAIVSDYGNGYMTKEHKNKFKPHHIRPSGSWPERSTGRALHWHLSGQGSNPCSGPEFFSPFSLLLKQR